jgi:creatinine amidohydrolase/Fe(II)-dependent formamide hydrolase-like protein
VTRHADRPWPAVGAEVVLVPVGSIEQHGPHLPLDTDTRIAVAVCEAVADSRPGVVVAPAITYGASGEHQAFPGTLSIGTEALTRVLVELSRSAEAMAAAIGQSLPHDADAEAMTATIGQSLPHDAPAEAMADVPGQAVPRLVFVNGHGGNVDAFAAAGVRVWHVSVPGGDAHAGRTETSLLLHLAPDVVGPAREPGNTMPLRDLLPALQNDGLRPHAPNGILGDPTGATAEEGAALFARLVDDLTTFLDRHGP